MTEVWNTAGQALLVVNGGPNDGRTIIMGKSTITMGRLPANDVVVNEPAVSRSHAEIVHADTGYYLRDLNSANGTFVNQKKIGNEAHLLQEGDQICLASTNITFVFGSDSGKTIQLPTRDLTSQGPNLVQGFSRETGSQRERAEALQANLRQLEAAYEQATNYARELAEEINEEGDDRDDSRQRRAAEVAREEERKRLAEELHDETMASLAAMALDVGLLRRQAGQATNASAGDMGNVEASLEQLGARLKDTNVRLRQMVQGIFPSVLSDMGLVAALRSYIEDVARRPIVNPYPLNIEFRAQGFDGERLPEEVEVGLYRVAQQGVTNAVQHARARNLLVELIWRDHEVSLTIADDGDGFDVENPKETTLTGHFGLTNLKDRTQALRGKLEITSKVSEGTTVSARIPVESQSPRSSEVQTSKHRVRMAPRGIA